MEIMAKGKFGTMVQTSYSLHLTFIGLCNANIFTQYNQQDATFHNFFISVRRCTFQTVFPFTRSSKLHIQCQVFVRPILLPAASLAGLTLYVQFWAPDDGRKNCLKHVQRLTEINKLWNVASCWLYCANIILSLLTVIYFIRCAETVNVCRNITALSEHSENKLDSSILHPAIYNTHWSYIQTGNHNSIATIVIKM